MNTSINGVLGFLAVLATPIFAPAQTGTDAAAPAASEAREIPLLSAEQLDEILGPIALYPDALIALILPASTMPTDLVLAARYLGAGGDTAQVDEQPWDESVRGLAHYPDVVKWMDEKLSWSIIVGDAFVAQPVDVMQSIQRLRARARAAGTLVDSAEQTVVEDESAIRIVPARPEVIYVPYYDPQVVYVARPYWGWASPVITYRWCYPTGIWLSYDCDWYSSRVWYVSTHHRHNWYYGNHWWRPYRSAPRHYYSNHDYGRGWSPRLGGAHPDARRGGRDRPSSVVVRDGHRESPSAPAPGSARSQPDRNRGSDVVRDGGERSRPDVRGGGSSGRGREDTVTDSRSGGRAPGSVRGGRSDDGERREATPGMRSGGSTRPDRRPESPRVVTTPSAPRVDVPPTNSRPPVTVPRNPSVVRNSEPAKNPVPSLARRTDRANNPGKAPTVRSERPASNPPSATPRVTSPAPELSRVVRVPTASGGSKSVVVNAPARVERTSPSPAPRSEARAPGSEARAPRASRGSEGGSEKTSARRRSSDG